MTDKTDNTVYVARPKGRPDESLKGKLNKWNNGYAEFIPAGSKPSNRTMLKQLGGSSFYKSEGEKDSSWSLHLNVDAKDCADPVAVLHEQFLFLTEGEQKQKPKLPDGSQGRMLLDNENLKIWLDSERGKVSILTELECSPQIERLLLQVESQMNVCIARYRQDIVNAKKE